MMKRYRHGILILVLLSGPSALATEPDSTSVESASTESAILTEYDNGLQLLVLPRPDESLAQVDVYLSLRGAARNAGMAHMVEHLMFTSTENCPQGSVRDSLQLLATYYQGSTSSRNVHTRTRCLPDLLPRMLAVEAERYGRLAPDEADLDHEKKRVLGEHEFRREAYTSQALGLRIIAMAYGEGNGDEGDPLIGAPETISGVGLAEVDTFVTKWLRPDRMVVMVSGPVDPDSVASVAAATFGMIEPAAGAVEIGELPPAPDPRRFVTRSEEDKDLLAIGFRLPYGTPEEAAIVHLTETIMDREDGNPVLVLFEDEALLILNIWADWSTQRADDVAADKAVEQFWKETRTVIRRVGDDWLFDRNRTSHVKDFTKRLKAPYRRTLWRAQRLADDRDLPAPEVLAAMVDTLAAERIQAYFAENFTPDKAFTAFAAGRPPNRNQYRKWNRGLRFRVNPYLVPDAGSAGLGVADIQPVLEAAAAGRIGKIDKVVLKNGIPVNLLPLADSSWVYLGGVRTYPGLEDEAPSRHPGRLRMYRSLVNWGYDRKGSNIPPRGDKPGFRTRVDSRVTSFRITARGPASKTDDVAGAMHKRVKVDKLNPFSFDWLVENLRNRYGKGYDEAPMVALAWRVGAVFGQDAPQLGWLQLDFEAMAAWSVGKANKLHKELCRTGNLQMVATGKVDPATVKETLDPNFGKRPKPEPGWYPVPARDGLAVEGAVVHDATSSVATLEFHFPPRDLSVEPVLGPVDLMVLANLYETSLRTAVQSAGFDSVSIYAWVDPAGAAALPKVRAVSRPEDAAEVLAIVRAELERIFVEPPTADEEARARVQLLGPLIEDLLSGRSARDLFLEIGIFGEIPPDVLGELARRDYGVITGTEGAIFPPDRYAWTVSVDKGLIQISDFGEARPAGTAAAVIELETR